MTIAALEALLPTLSLGCGARRILEIGTGDGQATLVLAATLPPDGMMISMEIDAVRASVAREQLGAEGRGQQVSVMVGDATRFLHKVAGPFDLIFQHGDRQQYEQMFDRLVDLLRPGGLLVIDGVAGRADDATMVTFRQRLEADSRLHTSYLPAGDGVSVSVKRAS